MARLIATLITVWLLWTAPFAGAYTQETQPATAPAGQSLQATITGVEGIVQVRNAETEAWKKATVGMVLGEGAEFRTGPKSAVRFTIPPDQTVTLDRLGTVKLLEAIKSGPKIKTDLGMKYGRVRYDIEAAGEEHDATIHSPGSTLAVRGTQVSVTNEGTFAVQVVSLTGVARHRDSKGKEITFGSTGDDRAEVVEGTTGAAETALLNTFVDPSISNARSQDEQLAILARPTNTFVTASPDISEISPDTPAPVIPPETPPTFDPGTLVFTLVWIQSEKVGVAPDLDLFVISPRGDRVDAKNNRMSTSGGRAIGPDDVGGGKPFRFAEETIAWPKQFPPGDFEYGVQHVKGGPAEFQLIVLKDGELIAEPVGDTINANIGQVRQRTNINRDTPPIKKGKPTSPTKPTRALKVARARK